MAADLSLWENQGVCCQQLSTRSSVLGCLGWDWHFQHFPKHGWETATALGKMTGRVWPLMAAGNPFLKSTNNMGVHFSKMRFMMTYYSSPWFFGKKILVMHLEIWRGFKWPKLVRYSFLGFGVCGPLPHDSPYSPEVGADRCQHVQLWGLFEIPTDSANIFFCIYRTESE